MWFYQKAKKVDSRAIIVLNAVKVTLEGDLVICIIKPTNTNIANQTNNQSNKTVHIPFCLNIAYTTDEWASKYIWIYLQKC